MGPGAAHGQRRRGSADGGLLRRCAAEPGPHTQPHAKQRPGFSSASDCTSTRCEQRLRDQPLVELDGPVTGQSVSLTGTANLDVGPTPYGLSIADTTGG